MASVITAPAYDPVTTATALAEKYVAGRRDILASQTSRAAAAARGLTELGSAISSFQTSLTALTGTGKTLYAQSATFSDTAIGTGSANAAAAPGNYAFFVQQLATASQVAFAGLSDDAGVGGKLSIRMGNSEAFKVDLDAADTDRNGILSTRELAAAINSDPKNLSKITASVITTGATSELVLTAKSTGENSKISINTDGIIFDEPTTQSSSLIAARDKMRTLVDATDAIIHIGSASGTPIQQASNTFTKAQAVGETPVSITVGANTAATTSNVQTFVDAYNRLQTSLSKLVFSGDPSTGSAAGIFANDAGVRALHDRLVSLVRPTGGTSLASFGIVATKDGTLELRSDRLQSQLALSPNGLDKLIGSTAVANPSGISSELDKYLDFWSDTSNGQISNRKSATEDLQVTLGEREAVIDQQYNTAYQRYLMQFTQLQTMQSVMNSNVSLFDALFGNDDN